MPVRSYSIVRYICSLQTLGFTNRSLVTVPNQTLFQHLGNTWVSIFSKALPIERLSLTQRSSIKKVDTHMFLHTARKMYASWRIRTSMATGWIAYNIVLHHNLSVRGSFLWCRFLYINHSRRALICTDKTNGRLFRCSATSWMMKPLCTKHQFFCLVSQNYPRLQNCIAASFHRPMQIRLRANQNHRFYLARLAKFCHNWDTRGSRVLRFLQLAAFCHVKGKHLTWLVHQDLDQGKQILDI